jgi:hypothetical protein
MGLQRVTENFRKREIERQLTNELQVARIQMASATTEEEKRKASGALQNALQRFTGFAARNIVPEEFLSPDQSINSSCPCLP